MTTTTLHIKAILTIGLLALTALTLRLLVILPCTPYARSRAPRPRKRGEPTHLLIVLGSGGHTAEMISMLRNAVLGRDRAMGRDIKAEKDAHSEKVGRDEDERDQKEEKTRLLDWRDYTHRTWVVSSGDTVSASRAAEVEEEFAAYYASSSTPSSHPSTSDNAYEKDIGKVGSYDIHTVPRARRIHQSLLTTPLTSLSCLGSCLRLLCFPATSSSSGRPHDLPDLILLNGPATATILVFASTLLKLFDIRGAWRRGKCRVVFVESFARVKGFSFSGRLLGYVVERVVVQWEGLAADAEVGGKTGTRTRGRGEFLGVLV